MINSFLVDHISLVDYIPGINRHRQFSKLLLKNCENLKIVLQKSAYIRSQLIKSLGISASQSSASLNERTFLEALIVFFKNLIFVMNVHIKLLYKTVDFLILLSS